MKRLVLSFSTLVALVLSTVQASACDIYGNGCYVHLDNPPTVQVTGSLPAGVTYGGAGGYVVSPAPTYTYTGPTTYTSPTYTSPVTNGTHGTYTTAPAYYPATTYTAPAPRYSPSAPVHYGYGYLPMVPADLGPVYTTEGSASSHGGLFGLAWWLND